MEGLRASVPVKINGKETSFWLDSGAFFSIMSNAKATELELKLEAPPFGFYLMGIGGNASAKVATVTNFGIANRVLKNVQFLVGGSDAGNGLLGRNLLSIADTEFDLANGSVKLIDARKCPKGAPAYWATGKPYFTVPLGPEQHSFNLPVSINKAKITAELDSGAPTSLLSRAAAQRAGIDLSGPGAVPLNNISGFGRRVMKGWLVPVESISVGDEQILRSHLTVIDGPIIAGNGAPDMLLGADFMLAHHIYVSRSQSRIYFTYSGGKPFLASPGVSPKQMTAVALPVGTHRVEAFSAASSEPKTAEDFARRGNYRLTQRSHKAAIGDLNEAIRLKPENAAYYRYRGTAFARSGQDMLARADLEKALKLDPADGETLLARGNLRLSEGDKIGALADAEAAVRATSPTSLDAIAIADLFERLNLPQRAIVLYGPVIATHKDDSRFGSLLNGRCWMRGLANVELDAALDDCTRSIRRDGKNAANLDSRGLIYMRKKDPANAIIDYDAALKLAPKLAWSLYLRGVAKINLGQIDSGKADQAAAKAIRPEIAEEAGRYGLKG